jgi:hypothetical protein
MIEARLREVFDSGDLSPFDCARVAMIAASSLSSLGSANRTAFRSFKSEFHSLAKRLILIAAQEFRRKYTKEFAPENGTVCISVENHVGIATSLSANCALSSEFKI